MNDNPTVEQLEKLNVLINSTHSSMLVTLLASSPTTHHDRIIDFYLSDYAHTETLIHILSHTHP